MASKRDKLTILEQRFVDQYIIDGNGTRAYKAAGYHAKSDRVAGVESHKLLKRPRIAAAIDAAQKARSKRTGVDADEVIKRLLEESKGPVHSARVSALTTLARVLGMLRERVDVHVGEPPAVPPGTMSAVLSSAEGLELLAKLRDEAQRHQRPTAIPPDAHQTKDQ
jgi:hypothetical protein